MTTTDATSLMDPATEIELLRTRLREVEAENERLKSVTVFQDCLAEFTQFAIGNNDLDSIFDKAVELLTRALNVEYVGIEEMRLDGPHPRLVLRCINNYKGLRDKLLGCTMVEIPPSNFVIPTASYIKGRQQQQQQRKNNTSTTTGDTSPRSLPSNFSICGVFDNNTSNNDFPWENYWITDENDNLIPSICTYVYHQSDPEPVTWQDYTKEKRFFIKTDVLPDVTAGMGVTIRTNSHRFSEIASSAGTDDVINDVLYNNIFGTKHRSRFQPSETYGLLLAVSARPRVFTPTEVNFFKLFSTTLGDILMRDRIFRALKESNDLFRSMADTSSPVLLWMSGPDAAFDFCNKQWLAFTGRTFEQERGNGWLDGVHPEDRERCWQIYSSHFREKKPFQMEFRLRRHDGQYRWILSTGAPRILDQGTFEGFIGSCVDITQHVSSEQVARESSKNEAALSAKRSFLATISHETRNPLNAIIGMNQLLRETKLNREQKSYSDAIQSASEVLLEIINDVLDISKIEAGKVNIECSQFDLREVIEPTLELMAHSHRKAFAQSNYNLLTTTAYGPTNNTVDIENNNNNEPSPFYHRHDKCEILSFISPRIPRMLHGDPARIRQIVMNFLSNARKFTTNGYIFLHADIEAETSTHVTVRIQCTDTGVGIREEDQKLLFQAFSQIEGGKKTTGGTGLGLYISKQLTQMMNGDIGVTSEFGKGSTFWVSLPLEKVAAAPAPAPAPGTSPFLSLQSPQQQRQTQSLVLVIHELDIVRQTICRYLNECGSTGYEGIAATTIHDNHDLLELMTRHKRPQQRQQQQGEGGKELRAIIIDNDYRSLVLALKRENRALFDSVHWIVLVNKKDTNGLLYNPRLRWGWSNFVSKPVRLESLINCVETTLAMPLPVETATNNNDDNSNNTATTSLFDRRRNSMQSMDDTTSIDSFSSFSMSDTDDGFEDPCPLHFSNMERRRRRNSSSSSSACDCNCHNCDCACGCEQRASSSCMIMTPPAELLSSASASASPAPPPPALTTMTTTIESSPPPPAAVSTSPSAHIMSSEEEASSVSVSVKQQQQQQQPYAATTTENKTSKTILLVEDNVLNQRVVQQMITAAGHQCDIACHGQDALEAMRTKRYDLIFMDCLMPVMSGYDCTIKIRELEKEAAANNDNDSTAGSSDRTPAEPPTTSTHQHNHIPIVALTANVMASDIQRCLDCGMDDFISKPTRKETVLEKIEKWTSIKKQQQQQQQQT